MIGNLSHVAIVVPDLAAAAEIYRSALGAQVSQPVELAAQGVTAVMVELPNAKVELLHPLGDDSPVANFLTRNPKGGMHHICYEVRDIKASIARLVSEGALVLGDGQPSIGVHGLPVVFLHPKDFCGTLIELEEHA